MHVNYPDDSNMSEIESKRFIARYVTINQAHDYIFWRQINCLVDNSRLELKRLRTSS